MSNLNEFLSEQLKDPEFNAEYETLEEKFIQIQAEIDERLNVCDKQ